MRAGLRFALISTVTVARAALLTASVVATALLAVVPFARETPPPTFAAPHEDKIWPLTPGHEKAQRDAAMRRVRVWAPANPAALDFRSNPPDPRGTLSELLVRCRYLPEPPRGTTPKFDCVLSDGEVVKVKYGRLTAEIHAEVAASRLLRALGFGADEMFLVPRVRCYGCPRFPFQTTEVLDRLRARERFVRLLPDDRYVDFEWAAVERRFAGHEIVAPDTNVEKGWGWWELNQVDPSVGASRTELDALRLMAMFLGHWDNKAPNQRLVCLDPHPDKPGPCRQPFALMHDLGASFGPNKMDRDSWQQKHIWVDAKECRISMRDLPHDGGTFPDVQISEAGRALAARQLGALSDQQIGDLFEGARFENFRGWDLRATSVDDWVRTFREKVSEISSAGPCPDRPSHPTD